MPVPWCVVYQYQLNKSFLGGICLPFLSSPIFGKKKTWLPGNSANVPVLGMVSENVTSSKAVGDLQLGDTKVFESPGPGVLYLAMFFVHVIDRS